MTKWLNSKIGLAPIDPLIVPASGIAYALTEFRKNVTASMVVNPKTPLAMLKTISTNTALRPRV